MTYRDPVTGKFAKRPKSPPLVHGLEWDAVPREYARPAPADRTDLFWSILAVIFMLGMAAATWLAIKGAS